MFSITVRDDTKKSRVVAVMLALRFASISLVNMPYQGVRQFWQRTVTLESWLLHCQLNLVVVRARPLIRKRQSNSIKKLVQQWIELVKQCEQLALVLAGTIAQRENDPPPPPSDAARIRSATSLASRTSGFDKTAPRRTVYPLFRYSLASKSKDLASRSKVRLQTGGCLRFVNSATAADSLQGLLICFCTLLLTLRCAATVLAMC